MSRIKVSIVMGAYNQRTILPLVLEGFETQDFPKDEYEVIVVDSTSTDGTSDFIKEYQASYKFTPIIRKNEGKAAARNAGVQAAQGDIVIITDSDMIPHAQLVSTHVQAHENTSVPTCFEGVTMNMTELHWPPEPSKLYPYISRSLQDGAKLGWYYFLTGNISFPKSLFLSYGGFDESFKSYGWEDLELGYRLSLDHQPLLFLKQAVNYHYHVVTEDEEIIRNVSKGESARLLFAKHPKLKLFLGGNVVSEFVRKKLSKEGVIYTFIKHKMYGSSVPSFHRFGFWFLKEYAYLTGFHNLKE